MILLTFFFGAVISSFQTSLSWSFIFDLCIFQRGTKKKPKRQTRTSATVFSLVMH